ncbi:hypothetical protein ACHAWC_006912 [Mediolabrus comicus]
MSDEESSQGDDAGGMFTDVTVGISDNVDNNDNNTAAGKSSSDAALLQELIARKKAKTSSSSSSKRTKRSSSSSSRTRPVVKLMVTSVSRSYSEPWRRKPQRESSGTGFLIQWEEDSNNQSIRIVTNAHVVRNATTVRARASFGPHVVSCEVEWLSLPLDLALLRITAGDWNDFCKGWSFDDLLKKSDDTTTNGNDNVVSETAAVKEGANMNGNNNNATKLLLLQEELPKLDENVSCVGFPTGGQQISVTRGVVSRIDVDSQYVLRIQIDAAINPGNSGGPVFDEKGQVVGIASSHLRGAGNIGYIIPSKIVSNFLQMCRDNDEVKVEDRFSGLGALVVQEECLEQTKHVPGIPNLAILGAQTLESKALRRNLGLEELDIIGGVRIVGSLKNNLSSQDNCSGDTLEGDDVLLSISGIPIGMDGTIQLSQSRPDERINFRSLVTCQRVGSKVKLDVLRKKERKELEVPLEMNRFLVAQYDDFDAIPLYAVVGGCVFTPLSLPLVSEKKSNKGSSFSRYYRDQRNGNEQMIVLSKVLNDEVNVGYHGWKNLILKSINGYEPINIQQLVDVLVRKLEGEMIEFRCQVVGEKDADYVICMSQQEVIRSENRVLQRHMIASWCSMEAISKELREELEAKESSEAKRKNAYHTMAAMRNITNG